MERISGLVDHILRPFVKDLPSFIEDNTDLIIFFFKNSLPHPKVPFWSF